MEGFFYVVDEISCKNELLLLVEQTVRQQNPPSNCQWAGVKMDIIWVAHKSLLFYYYNFRSDIVYIFQLCTLVLTTKQVNINNKKSLALESMCDILVTSN